MPEVGVTKLDSDDTWPVVVREYLPPLALVAVISGLAIVILRIIMELLHAGVALAALAQELQEIVRNVLPRVVH